MSSSPLHNYSNHRATSATGMAYINYTLRQLKALSGPRGRALKAYWEKQVSACPTLNLPFDFPRPKLSTFQGDVYLDPLDHDAYYPIVQLAEATSSNPYSIFLSLFYIFLGRLTRQTDIPIGVPTSTSSYDGQQNTADDLVGMIANSLLCRVELSDNPSFQSFLKRVEQVLKVAYTHRDYPLWLLTQEGYKSQEDPMLSVAFSWEEQSFSQSTAADPKNLVIEPYPLGEQRGGSFDLYLTVLETAQGLQLCWKYSSDLFKRSSIIQFAKRFRILLAAVIANPEQSILQLPFLTDAEQTSLLLQARPLEICAPPQECVHTLFEAQVQRTPHAVAVVSEGELLTYQQLNQRANQLAQYLQTKGLKSETLVGIYLHRSPTLIVALLGVLKAGAAYLPLNPDLPQERLEYMVEASQINWLLSSSQLSQHLINCIPDIIYLDTEWLTIAQHSKQNPNSCTTSQHLAYVIYTSGSTGKPKGVLIEHQSVSNFIQASIENYELTHTDRILQFASISFDAAVEEIYPCLSVGSTLVLRPPAMLDSIPTFLDYCQDYCLTILDLPTAFWHQLVDFLVVTPNASIPPSIRLIIIGGERVNAHHVNHWYRQLSNAPMVINTYGPTEATVVATLYKIPVDYSCADNSTHIASIPIGKALNNVETYILDEQAQLVPPGAVGELYIGGLGLARGYLNAPEQTQTNFIAHPFCSDAQAYLYKTGDLVRYLPNGNLEFIGRVDHQVKIRGYRVELGEIESVIVQHSGVQQALVVASQTISSRSKSLIAYIVSDLIPERILYHADCLLELDERLIQISIQSITYESIQLTANTLSLEPGKFIRIRLLLPGESEERWFQGTVALDTTASNHSVIELCLSALERKDILSSIAYLLDTTEHISASQRTFKQQLKGYLETSLPDYMIPSTFVLMNALPLTTNGKVDRAALPLPSNYDNLDIQLSQEEVPKTPIEIQIAEIWKGVLGKQHVSICTSFLELGGNSLQVIELLTQIQTQFAIKISTQSFLQNPTITQLAAFIANQGQSLIHHPQTATIDLTVEAQLDSDIQFFDITPK
ncbi:MAG: amino acid adenylation domain-containing protein, partial [Cyanobacteria bacterium P01_H01_bin.105]